MAKYITTADLVGAGNYLPSISADDVATIATLDKMVDAASRLADHYTTRGENAFDPATAQNPQTRIFYGNGTSLLPLSPFRISDFIGGSVTIPAGVVIAEGGIETPNFRIDGVGRMIALSPEGYLTPGVYVWPDGAPVSVTGKWGFAATPPDIREATAQTVVRWWRGKDEAFSGVIGRINSDQTIIERDLPAPVRLILDLYRARKPTFA